jgi:hypothetical protein
MASILFVVQRKCGIGLTWQRNSKAHLAFLWVSSDRLLGAAIIREGLAFCRITSLKELWQWVGLLTYGKWGIQSHDQSINKINISISSVILYIVYTCLINPLSIKELFDYSIYLVFFCWEVLLKRLWILQRQQIKKKATASFLDHRSWNY